MNQFLAILLLLPLMEFAQSNSQVLRVFITTVADDLRMEQSVMANVYMHDSQRDMPDIEFIIHSAGRK